MCVLLWNKAKTFLKEEWATIKFIKSNIKQKIQVRTEKRPIGRRIDHEDNNIQSLWLFTRKQSQKFCLGSCLCKRIFSLSFVQGKHYSKYNFSSHFLIFFSLLLTYYFKKHLFVPQWTLSRHVFNFSFYSEKEVNIFKG